MHIGFYAYTLIIDFGAFARCWAQLRQSRHSLTGMRVSAGLSAAHGPVCTLYARLARPARTGKQRGRPLTVKPNQARDPRSRCPSAGCMCPPAPVPLPRPWLIVNPAHCIGNREIVWTGRWSEGYLCLQLPLVLSAVLFVCFLPVVITWRVQMSGWPRHPLPIRLVGTADAPFDQSAGLS